MTVGRVLSIGEEQESRSLSPALNINVGMIILPSFFLYMAFYLYTYLRRDKVEFYEVVEGSIVNDTRHTGSFSGRRARNIRTVPGNINFYMREGKRAAVGTKSLLDR